MKRRHKWNEPKGVHKGTSNKGGFAVMCIKCGCVKEYVNGVPTYFINDNVYDKITPDCKPHNHPHN